MAYVDKARGVLTGNHSGSSWIMVINLTTGARTPFHPGSQPNVQPTR
nr:hypothetical protein GCM10020092_027430 [Actinoplanes digitatis]